MPNIDPSEYERSVRVRRLRASDYDAVRAVQQKAFQTIDPWTREEFESQLRTFPAGQLGVEYDDELVGVSASLIVVGAEAQTAHEFEDITDDGRIRNHRKDGDYLYGIDIAIDPEFQGQRLARRLYDARKDLCRRQNLAGMIIGGRIPGYGSHAEEMSPEDYAERVEQRLLNDPVLNAQLANGFRVLRILHGYMPEDVQSAGHATLMEWRNPEYKEPNAARIRTARLCVVQYEMRKIASFDDFARQCEFFVSAGSDYRSDFVLFPELLTTQLLPLVGDARGYEAARAIAAYTPDYLDLFTDLAIRYNVNIAGGTHLTVEDGATYNVAYLFGRNGSIDRQYKIHITPSEASHWGVIGGDTVQVFDTDRGKVAILICYDIEFPELARIAVHKGAELIFVPSNTDMRSGHLRVSRCAMARCIENHVYVAQAGAIGNLPSVDAAEVHYAQSAIYTPSDIAFDRDGIAAECSPNTEMVIVHDLNLDTLARHRIEGTTHNWNDRRTDLYRLHVGDGHLKI